MAGVLGMLFVEAVGLGPWGSAPFRVGQLHWLWGFLIIDDAGTASSGLKWALYMLPSKANCCSGKRSELSKHCAKLKWLHSGLRFTFVSEAPC